MFKAAINTYRHTMYESHHCRPQTTNYFNLERNLLFKKKGFNSDCPNLILCICRHSAGDSPGARRRGGPGEQIG